MIDPQHFPPLLLPYRNRYLTACDNAARWMARRARLAGYVESQVRSGRDRADLALLESELRRVAAIVDQVRLESLRAERELTDQARKQRTSEIPALFRDEANRLLQAEAYEIASLSSATRLSTEETVHVLHAPPSRRAPLERALPEVAQAFRAKHEASFLMRKRVLAKVAESNRQAARIRAAYDEKLAILGSGDRRAAP